MSQIKNVKKRIKQTPKILIIKKIRDINVNILAIDSQVRFRNKP